MSEEISSFTALTTPAAGDLLPIVDVSDTTDAATGTTKKITYANLKFLQLDGVVPMDAGASIDFTNATGDVITNGTNSSKIYNVGVNDGLAFGNGAFFNGVFSTGAVMGNFNTQAGILGDNGLLSITAQNYTHQVDIDVNGIVGTRTISVPNRDVTIASTEGIQLSTTVTTTSGAGAVAITGGRHDVTTTGTGDALTLSNGQGGQVLDIVYVAEAAGADTAILTPISILGYTTITFNAIGDAVRLSYGTGGWAIISAQGVTLA